MNKKKKAVQNSLGISSHFEREAKIMVGFFVIFILIALLAGIMGPWIIRVSNIDKCLDNGDAFDHKKTKCTILHKSKNQ